MSRGIWESHAGYLKWLEGQSKYRLPRIYRETLVAVLRGRVNGEANLYALPLEDLAKRLDLSLSAAQRRVRWLVEHHYLIVCRGGYRTHAQEYHRSTEAHPYSRWSSYPGCECGGERKRPEFQTEKGRRALGRKVGVSVIEKGRRFATPTTYHPDAAPLSTGQRYVRLRRSNEEEMDDRLLALLASAADSFASLAEVFGEVGTLAQPPTRLTLVPDSDSEG